MARILLIDDDADLGHYLQLALEERGHVVEYQERAEHGPDLLAAGGFDVVLTTRCRACPGSISWLRYSSAASAFR
jgi:DNA-binding response OmpR family regulator